MNAVLETDALGKQYRRRHRAPADEPEAAQRLCGHRVCPGIGRVPNPVAAGTSGGLLGRSKSRTQAPVNLKSTLENCAATVARSYHQEVTYQPATRYWSFQWYELGIYLGPALPLAGVSIGLVRRGRFCG